MAVVKEVLGTPLIKKSFKLFMLKVAAVLNRLDEFKDVVLSNSPVYI